MECNGGREPNGSSVGGHQIEMNRSFYPLISVFVVSVGYASICRAGQISYITFDFSIIILAIQNFLIDFKIL